MQMGDKEIKKKLFGTNGVRGVIGQSMTPGLVMGIGASLATMRKGRIAVARDSRTSGIPLVHALKAGIMMAGCDVVDLGLMPTPALQYLVKTQFDAGAVVTASHNPPQYNGVKIIESDGTEMDDTEVIKLESLLFEESFECVNWRFVGREHDAEYLSQEYISAVSGHFSGDIGNGIRVVVDPGSGAACGFTAEILRRMGCSVFTVNSRPDGTFPGRLPEPSRDGLRTLSDMVREIKADFGVAHDGDADRAVFVDEKGNFIPENHEFALIADHIGRREKGIIVTPVSTSRIVEDIATLNDCSIVYTPVGSIYVGRKMLELAGNGERVILGGENNGGLLYPDHQYCRDGAMTAAMMVTILSESGSRLSELVKSLPVYHIFNEKYSTSNGEKIMALLEERYSEEDLDFTDGIKIKLGRTWGLIRSSGTEPLVRLIVESDEETNAKNLFEELSKIIRQNL